MQRENGNILILILTSLLFHFKINTPVVVIIDKHTKRNFRIWKTCLLNHKKYIFFEPSKIYQHHDAVGFAPFNFFSSSFFDQNNVEKMNIWALWVGSTLTFSNFFSFWVETKSRNLISKKKCIDRTLVLFLHSNVAMSNADRGNDLCVAVI